MNSQKEKVDKKKENGRRRSSLRLNNDNSNDKEKGLRNEQQKPDVSICLKYRTFLNALDT